MPNPFALIDRLEIDFELPPAPGPLARADQWFNRLSEPQRIGVALLVMLFLAASACYCLGLGSTVLVNRAEAELAAQEAELAASLPTIDPTPVEPESTPTAIVIPTEIPTVRPTPAATQMIDYPTPIPAQLLPTVPLQPSQPRPAAPAQAAPPRLVAPPEPPTPTPPARGAAPATKPNTSGGTSGGTPAAKPGAPTPALSVPAAKPGATAPAVVGTRPAGGSAPVATSAPAPKPGQSTGVTPATRPTSAPVINPFPSKPVGTPAAKPSTR